MRRLCTFLLPILVFVIGLVVGCTVSAYFWVRWADTYMTDSSIAGIGERYAVLQVLRTGDTNKAIDALEEEMNGEVLQFAAMKRGVLVAKLKPSEVRLITRVRDYRAAHPYSSGDTEIDRFVASVLSLTNKTMWPNTALEPTATAP